MSPDGRGAAEAAGGQSPGAPTAARCPQCGGGVPVRDDAPFLSCEHCRVPLALDVEGFVLHLAGVPRLSERDAVGAVRAFLTGAEVPDPPVDAAAELSWRPWVRVPRAAGVEMIPASGDAADAGADGGLRPEAAAAYVPFDPAIAESPGFVPSCLAARDAAAAVAGSDLRGVRLVHVPVWRVAYTVRGAAYAADVDAASGRVFAWWVPPTAARANDRRAILLFGALIAGFTCVGIVAGDCWTGFLATGVAAALCIGAMRALDRRPA